LPVARLLTGVPTLASARIGGSGGPWAGFWSWRPDQAEPGGELAWLGYLAPQADVAVGSDGEQAAAGVAGDAVDVDQRAQRQGGGQARVTVQEHVHAMACTVNGIVAGYDGSPASQEALDWAALEVPVAARAVTATAGLAGRR
jgi:hypothetical protein